MLHVAGVPTRANPSHSRSIQDRSPCKGKQSARGLPLATPVSFSARRAARRCPDSAAQLTGAFRTLADAPPARRRHARCHCPVQAGGRRCRPLCCPPPVSQVPTTSGAPPVPRTALARTPEGSQAHCRGRGGAGWRNRPAAARAAVAQPRLIQSPMLTAHPLLPLDLQWPVRGRSALRCCPPRGRSGRLGGACRTRRRRLCRQPAHGPGEQGVDQPALQGGQSCRCMGSGVVPLHHAGMRTGARPSITMEGNAAVQAPCVPALETLLASRPHPPNTPEQAALAGNFTFDELQAKSYLEVKGSTLANQCPILG